MAAPAMVHSEHVSEVPDADVADHSTKFAEIECSEYVSDKATVCGKGNLVFLVFVECTLAEKGGCKASAFTD